ncbi:trehalose-phosphatase [Microbacterium sp. ZXX196]|nr:trehalose-phosphatase [Microbacterium sp. ZXX196]MTE24766.1 trehalose-phosphatase [Microbacterium sp. ZXX196]
MGSAPRLLVALDFDGTLAPLVDEPMSARATPDAARAVAALADTPGTTVALVSGRTLADLRVIAEHRDDSPIWLVGSHGAERWRPGQEDAAPGEGAAAGGSARLADDAERAVTGIDGAWIENKAFGFALHTRLADPAGEARAQAAVDELMEREAPGWRRRTGKHVVEFADRHEGKDVAIAELRRETGASAVVFAGDDVTDEDALRSLEDGDLGIRVGDGETAARVRVGDTPELAAVLTRLAQHRAS